MTSLNQTLTRVTWLTGAMLLLLSALAEPNGDVERRLDLGRRVTFEANRGQAAPQATFLARGPGYTVFLTSGEAVLALGRSGTGGTVRLAPIDASEDSALVPEEEVPVVVTYAGIGRSAAVSVPTYARVRRVGVYPGIDLVFRGHARTLEYDWIVGPGADPARIAMAVHGADGLGVDADGALVAHTPGGDLRQPRPFAYQDIDGERRAVSADYVVDGEGHVRIRLGDYDRSRALVIDPVLDYATYLGGSDDEGDWRYGAVFGIALDAAGNAYVTGTTRSADFPTTPGADRTLGGQQDIFVAKFSPTGALLYSTFVGGPCDDIARGIAVDAGGNAYVTGRANAGFCSPDLAPGVLVAKLDPTGALVYALTFGGSIADTSIGQVIAVDAAGAAYVTGLTDSSSRDFPTTPGALRTEPCDPVYSWESADGFVAKIDPQGTGLVYSTYLCGSAHESPNGLAIDAAGNAYVAGSTASLDFPLVNPLQPAPAGDMITSFVSKLDPTGSHLVYSTYLGGSGGDVIGAIAVDAHGNAYVTGSTSSVDYPTTPGALQPQPGDRWLCAPQICTDAFVTKIDPTGSRLVYSTYLYGESDDAGNHIAVDAAGNAYVAGATSSSYFPIVDAFQPTMGALFDGFVVKLNPDGTRLVYASYLGGSRSGTSPIVGWDGASSIAVDAQGRAWVAGYTQSDDFPTTPNALQRQIGPGSCDMFGTPCTDGFVVRIGAGGPGVTPAVSLIVDRPDVAPGGTATASWAGVPIPSASDEVRLYTLGSLAGPSDHLAAWSTQGAPAGALSLTLPADLVPGMYELRLLSPDPSYFGIMSVIARTRPIRVAAPAADLIVTSVETTPAAPVAGQPVAVNATVKNQGSLAAGGFAVDVYKHMAAAPGTGVVGDVRCAIAGLAPGATAHCTGSVTYAAAGTFAMWAQVDTARAVAEADEANNVMGPRPIAVAANAARPDLVVLSVGNPPASAAPGKALAVAHTVKNQGAAAAGPSIARFYLASGPSRAPGDTLLAGTRTVSTLAAGAQSAGTTTVTIPPATAPGSYRLLACADDTALVAEASETNNCLAAPASIVIGWPDLVESAVGDPPAAARPGATFTTTDTARNAGLVTAGASITRYYLSTDAQRGAGDIALGQRSVPSLPPGASSTQAVTLTIPTTAAPGTYLVLACADDAKAVVESDEANNCRASASAVAVALPDLVQQSVSNAGGPFRRGSAFTVSDTAVNSARVATPRAATTRYYLSLDATRGTGDVLLAGSRVVPILAPAAASTGSVSVVIPSTTAPGTYAVIACADDTKVIGEQSEANNCSASATRVAVAP